MILGVVRSGRASVAPFAVGGYIAAAYWFTSSTSFANPAVTIGRTLTQHLRRHQAEQSSRCSSSCSCSARSLAVVLVRVPVPRHPRDDLVVPHESPEAS